VLQTKFHFFKSEILYPVDSTCEKVKIMLHNPRDHMHEYFVADLPNFFTGNRTTLRKNILLPSTARTWRKVGNREEYFPVSRKIMVDYYTGRAYSAGCPGGGKK
jgi:hypothetical protein